MVFYPPKTVQIKKIDKFNTFWYFFDLSMERRTFSLERRTFHWSEGLFTESEGDFGYFSKKHLHFQRNTTLFDPFSKNHRLIDILTILAEGMKGIFKESPTYWYFDHFSRGNEGDLILFFKETPTYWPFFKESLRNTLFLTFFKDLSYLLIIFQRNTYKSIIFNNFDLKILFFIIILIILTFLIYFNIL